MWVIFRLLISHLLIDHSLSYSNFLVPNFLAFYILSSIALIFIAAGGYVYNDLCDIEIDKVNKGENIVITKFIEPNKALWFSTSLFAIGLVCCAVTSIGMNNLVFLVISLILVFLLVFYSKWAKSKFIIGNIVVSLTLSATAITACLLFYVGESTNPIYLYDMLELGALIFIVSFSREIVKDIEDYQGDKIHGCKTIPIVLGILPAKIISLIPIATILGLCIYSFFTGSKEVLIIILAVFSLLIIVQILLSKTKKHFMLSSLSLKLYILFGLAYLFLLT